MKKKCEKTSCIIIHRRILLICISIFISILNGCASLTNGRRINGQVETLDNMEEPLIVFYDGAGYYLIKSFMESHPEINIEIVNCIPSAGESIDYKTLIAKNGTPDLIIASEDISGYLPEWYEKGYIADLGEFYSNDVSVVEDDYFPETFDIFRKDSILYALPLGITMDCIIISESNYAESSFSKLTDEYTGKELLNIMLEEINKEKAKDEFFTETSCNILDFLYYFDAVKKTADDIEIDQELFKQIYEIMYLGLKEADEAISFWNDLGISFESSEGYAYPGAIEPRRYDGKFTVSMGGVDSAPAVVLSYAETISQYYRDEGIKAVYFPTIDDGSKYQASVEVWAAICEESNRKQLAYELLRALMDEEIKSFGGISGMLVPLGGSFHSCNVYPINRRNAISFLETFESQTEYLVYNQWSSLASLEDITIVDRINVNEYEKEKHKRMLSDISGLYLVNAALNDEVRDIFSNYYNADVFNYEYCYLEIQNALNENCDL